LNIIHPEDIPQKVNKLLMDKWGISLFKFAQIFAVSPTDIYIQKGNKPFNSEELRELKNSLIKMWKQVLNRARHIEQMFSKAGGLPSRAFSDYELVKEEGLDALYHQYILPRELLAFYVEKTRQLGKRGIGLCKKSIIAVGWGNLVANKGYRIDWKLLGDLYFWFWEKINTYKSYKEWAPTEGIEDYLKVQYHRHRLACGLDNYLMNIDQLLDYKDEKQNLQFWRRLILFKWAEGKIADNEVRRLLLNIITDLFLAANEGLTIFSPTEAFADPNFGYLRLWAKSKKGIELFPVNAEWVRLAETVYKVGTELPKEGTEIGENFLYAVSLYLDNKADMNNLPPMIIFPNRSYFSPCL